MFNAVTIAREYGSGGAEIGRRLAERLGWELVDRQIIERVAAMGKVDRNWAEEADEHCSAWWERVLKAFVTVDRKFIWAESPMREWTAIPCNNSRPTSSRRRQILENV